MKNDVKSRFYDIVFEVDTKSGKIFDIILLIAITLSIFFVMLESVVAIEIEYGVWLKYAEWVVTIVFTIEYLLRIWMVKKPISYIISFYGIIDLFSILPTYIGLFVSGAHGLVVIRAIRLLRVFRILKLSRYVSESRTLFFALKASHTKISVFLYSIVMIIIIVGTLMYIIEGPEHGFTSIPESIYWAIVTLTTVGYGDITPETVLGKTISSLVMVLGYAIIAVPTGIVTAELTAKNKKNQPITTITCHECLSERHDSDADFCKYCGQQLENENA